MNESITQNDKQISNSIKRFFTRFHISSALKASRIIKDAIVPLDSENRTNVLIIDDSMFEHNRFKKVELLAKSITSFSMFGAPIEKPNCCSHNLQIIKTLQALFISKELDVFFNDWLIFFLNSQIHRQ